MVRLFFPLRSRYASDVPIPHEAIISYLREKGYAPMEIYDWFLIADNAFSEWVAEQRKKEHEALEKRHARHSIRH